MRSIRLYIQDILDCFKAIEGFLGNMSFTEFQNDDKTASAVVRKFEVVGEAAKNIPDAVREKYPEIPWKEMAGLRDKLIHFYFGVKYDLVWQTAKTRIPQLVPMMNEVLKELDT